jgi:ABC-2 type transport system permease protein
MTSIATPRVPPGHYRFPQAARMEWIKLWSLRSTWWTLAVTAAAATGIGTAVGLNTRNASGDLTNNALAGIAPGLLFAGVLGVLAVTSEYTFGMIRATLATIPNRRLLLAAKAAVFGALTLATGEATAFIAFFAGGAALRHGISAPTLSQPGVLQAVVLSGTGFGLIGLIGLGLGAIIRHTPAAIAVLVGGVYIVAQFVGGITGALMAYVPISIVANSMATTRNPMLSPWLGLGLLCLYAAVLLGIGGWLFTRRDA